MIGIGIFEGSFDGLCDLILPGTSYLERDGTTVNLEGRLQRQRRAVIAPCPDELAWIAKLGERFGVEISPYASPLRRVSAICYGGISFGEIGEQAALPPRAEAAAACRTRRSKPATGDGAPAADLPAALLRPAVERTPELQFQRPGGEIELARADARARGVAPVTPSPFLERDLARAAREGRARPAAGHVRIAQPEAGDLHPFVEVTK